ncbi:restriction endonuclease [Dyadobacter flavalbus]|uniref:Restriction endonuclease n=1 Tax=Dyadobacter flavalbus TaxID=2579942 RepID=A0A5M8QP85_9BACT|nr:restriction endonuclease [Dyadobacter flavalbus]KAA6436814.1 restriction endonuclease [Dyadobacter flavalbus]
MAKEKPVLDFKTLIEEAKQFSINESKLHPEIYGTTDGKAIGTLIESKFKVHLTEKYALGASSAAKGLDLPSVLTDIKVTSIRQPQSSSPFKDAKQKIYGLGYNLLLFVYDKEDDHEQKAAKLDFKSCAFITKERTADYTITMRLRQMLNDDANIEDIMAYLSDRNIPADDISLKKIAEQILKSPPELGYLTMSNALQWRLQYSRIVGLSKEVDGIIKIIDKVNNI